MVIWVFTGILHIGMQEMYKLVFFPLRRSFSVALISLLHGFEFRNFFHNSVWLKIPCFHMYNEKNSCKFAFVMLLYLISI